MTDKTGIVEFANTLVDLGFEIVSTGGTAKLIKDTSVIPCTTVESVTGFPEMLDGRVKTLHPKIFAGIIADQRNPKHMNTIAEHGIQPFGLVVVNLYEFEKDPSIEKIDVGGPSMIRAAAKNSESVIVVVDPTDYAMVLNHIRETGEVDEDTRFALAAKAFRVTANYDAMIAETYEKHVGNSTHLPSGVAH